MTSELRKNSKFGVNAIISLAYIKQSQVSLWEPWQKIVSNPEVYSEPCQTVCQIKCFVKMIIFFVKHSILEVWQNSEYASVICYSLFGKIDGANKIDLVAM